MNIDKLIPAKYGLSLDDCFGSLMNIDKLIRFRFVRGPVERFGSLMNIDKLIPVMTDVNWIAGFGSLRNIKLKETACGILFCKLLFYIQRGDRGTAFFGII